MSTDNIDNLSYNLSTNTHTQTRPFLKKDFFYVNDNLGSVNYSTNQITFETVSLASNGRFSNFDEAIIQIPMVGVLEGVATAVIAKSTGTVVGLSADVVAGGVLPDWSSNLNAYSLSDPICVKNTHNNLIHSIAIDYGNGSVIQPCANINQYLTFKMHTEMSLDDEAINGPLLNYAKDSPSWGYNTAVGGSGIGLYNNVAPVNSASEGNMHNVDFVNHGVSKRQKFFSKSVNGRHVVHGDAMKMMRSGQQVVCNHTTGKAYYWVASFRLRDLPFFNAGLGLVRGSLIKITLTLNNNVSFKFTKDSNDFLSMVPNSFSNVSGLTNPYMVVSSISKQKGSSITSATATTANGLFLNTALHESLIPSGCAPLASNATYTFTSAIGQVKTANAEYTHALRNCRLVVPSVIMNNETMAMYTQVRQKKIVYNDINYSYFNVNVDPTNSQTAFQYTLVSNLARAQRLIIVPIMNHTGTNGNAYDAGATPTTNILSPLTSCFTTEPSTCSPYTITNFNCTLGGINVYQNQITYSYEQFLMEMNGVYGKNSNLLTGDSSSRISLQDYNQNYKYIVIDLTRRMAKDDATLQSIAVSGNLTSQKDMMFHCFIEYNKNITIDVADGTVVFE